MEILGSIRRVNAEWAAKLTQSEAEQVIDIVRGLVWLLIFAREKVKKTKDESIQKKLEKIVKLTEGLIKAVEELVESGDDDRKPLLEAMEDTVRTIEDGTPEIQAIRETKEFLKTLIDKKGTSK